MVNHAGDRSIFNTVTLGNEQQLFDEKFDRLWQELKREFVSLKNSYHDRSADTNECLSKGIARIIEDAKNDTGIPDEETLERIVADEGSWDGAFDALMQKVRAHLSRKFLSLDTDLDISLENAKKRCLVFLKKRWSLMNKLSSEEGSNFLQGIKDACDVPDYKLELIVEALDVLNRFKLSFRGFLQHRIRAELNILEPDTTYYKRRNYS